MDNTELLRLILQYGQNRSHAAVYLNSAYYAQTAESTEEWFEKATNARAQEIRTLQLIKDTLKTDTPHK